MFVRVAKRFMPVTEGYEGQRLFTRRNGALFMTPLFLVLLVIESTDVVFAVDSIPAIYAVTDDPFIVFTSNVFAILGLARALFRAQRLHVRIRLPQTGTGLHPRLRRYEDAAGRRVQGPSAGQPRRDSDDHLRCGDCIHRRETAGASGNHAPTTGLGALANRPDARSAQAAEQPRVDVTSPLC